MRSWRFEWRCIFITSEISLWIHHPVRHYSASSLGMSSALSGFLSIDALSNHHSPHVFLNVFSVVIGPLLFGCCFLVWFNYPNHTNQYPTLHYNSNQQPVNCSFLFALTFPLLHSVLISSKNLWFSGFTYVWTVIWMCQYILTLWLLVLMVGLHKLFICVVRSNLHYIDTFTWSPHTNLHHL